MNSVYLKSIRIDNIRSIGESALIEWGKGVTILLAPNGTGKTSVFEAIELALTGKVRRLRDELSTLVRDGREHAKVSLDFGSTGVLTAEVNKKSEVTYYGDKRSIFGHDFSEDNLDYLLRLTHLFDQRDIEWCTQAESEEAGSQLAMLPHTRHSVNAIKAIASARRRLNKLRNESDKDLAAQNQKLSLWNKLRTQYSEIESNSSTSLISLNELGDVIRRLTDRWAESPTSIDIEGIKQSAAGLGPVFDRELENLRIANLRLSKLHAIASEFSTLTARLEQAGKDRDVGSAVVEELKKNLQRLRDEISTLYELEANAKARLTLARQKATDAEALERASVELESLTKNLTELERLEKHSIVKKAKLSDDREEAIDFAQQHQEHRSKRASLIREKESLESSISSVDDWEQTLSQVSLLRERYRSTYSVMSLTVHELEECKINKENDESLVEEAKASFLDLTSVSDAIRGAISTIYEYLPTNQSECPICKVNHGASRLRELLLAAMENVSPEISQAAKNLRSCEMRLSKRNADLRAIENKIHNLSSELSAHTKLGDEGNRHVESLLLKLDARGLPPDEYRQTLIQKIEENSNASQSLDLAALFLPEEPTPEAIVQLERDLLHNETELQRIKGLIKVANDTKNKLNSKLQALEILVSSQDPVPNLSDMESGLTATSTRIEALKLDTKLLTIKLQTAESDLNRLETAVTEVGLRIQSHLSAWNGAELPGTPNNFALTEAKRQIELDIAALHKEQKLATHVLTEVAKWESSELRKQIQSSLDELRGPLEEGAFELSLGAELSRLQHQIDNFKRVHEALSKLSDELNSSLGDLRTQMESVQASWQLLIRRIILEPRFALTELNQSSYYRKEQAEVIVKVHGSNVRASNVASKAQAADLQLTFLLAMAVEKAWAPWKAVLLDDPTQHHDIVHASAVFDVLREYVADRGFQVLFATHDRLQARFFRRKLENDGIPVKVCELRPTPLGVMPMEKIT